MIVELIIPIEGLRGKLQQDGYYFRMYRAQQIVQRCQTGGIRSMKAWYWKQEGDLYDAQHQ